MQWQLALAGAGWTLDGASYPTVNSTLTVGQTGFPFRGTLRNAYDIRRVTVSIRKSNGSNAISPATATPNAKSYDLSRLDDAVAFSRLGVGGYTLVIAAENTAGDNYRLESKFYVTTAPMWCHSTPAAAPAPRAPAWYPPVRSTAICPRR